MPRPTESEIEKRKADRVPGLYLGKLLEWKVVWQDRYLVCRYLPTAGAAHWRNKVVQSLYGIRSDVIVGGENQGEEIPDIEGGQGELPTLPKKMILKIRPMIPSRITIPSRPAMVM